jgi:hypothetical protein
MDIDLLNYKTQKFDLNLNEFMEKLDIEKSINKEKNNINTYIKEDFRSKNTYLFTDKDGNDILESVKNGNVNNNNLINKYIVNTVNGTELNNENNVYLIKYLSTQLFLSNIYKLLHKYFSLYNFVFNSFFKISFNNTKFLSKKVIVKLYKNSNNDILFEIKDMDSYMVFYDLFGTAKDFFILYTIHINININFTQGKVNIVFDYSDNNNNTPYILLNILLNNSLNKFNKKNIINKKNLDDIIQNIYTKIYTF